MSTDKIVGGVGRRGVLGGLVGAALGGRQAAKAVLQQANESLFLSRSMETYRRLRMDTVQTNNSEKAYPGAPKDFDFAGTLKGILSDKETMDTLRSMISAEIGYPDPNHLDWDLRQNKCYSMAAKIYYQRQRYIERRLADVLRVQEEQSIRSIISKWFNDKTGYWL